jgi:excisionase family DNA binding protein
MASNRKYKPSPARALYIEVTEATYLLRSGRDTVEATIKARKLKARMVGARYLIPASEIMEDRHDRAA